MYLDQAHINLVSVRSPLDVVWLFGKQYEQNLILGEFVLMSNDKRWKKHLTVSLDVQPPLSKLRGLNSTPGHHNLFLLYHVQSGEGMGNLQTRITDPNDS